MMLMILISILLAGVQIGGQDVLQEFCNSVLSLKYTDGYSGKSVPLYKSLDERVVNTLATKYASELMVCRKVPKIPGDLYKMIKELPKTSTVFQFETAANLKLNGPLSLKKANILSATGVDGRMLMVKILLIDPDCQLPVDTRKAQLKFEAEICKELQVLNSHLSLVPTKVYHVSHPHHSTYHTDLTGLVMRLATLAPCQTLHRSFLCQLSRVWNVSRQLLSSSINGRSTRMWRDLCIWTLKAATFLLMSVVLGFWETLGQQDLSTVVLFLALKVFTL